MIHLGTGDPSCWDSSGKLNELKKERTKKDQNLPND